MLKRHEDQLMNHIDELTYRGWTHITWGELYHWYGLERLSKKAWRDLRDRFLEDNEGELHIYENANEGVLLIHNDGLSTLSEKVGDGGSEE